MLTKGRSEDALTINPRLNNDILVTDIAVWEEVSPHWMHGEVVPLPEQKKSKIGCKAFLRTKEKDDQIQLLFSN